MILFSVWFCKGANLYLHTFPVALVVANSKLKVSYVEIVANNPIYHGRGDPYVMSYKLVYSLH